MKVHTLTSCSALIILHFFLTTMVDAFTLQPPPHHSCYDSIYSRSIATPTSSISAIATATSTSLFAKQKSKKKRATRNTIGNRTQSTSGFGGAAVSPCPCGSGDAYNKCCGRLHSNAKTYGEATAEEVVRARYSAYAKREVSLL